MKPLVFLVFLDCIEIFWKSKMVPGGGIEPPTRGFSVPCSTPELPGQRDKKFRSLNSAYRRIRASCKDYFSHDCQNISCKHGHSSSYIYNSVKSMPSIRSIKDGVLRLRVTSNNPSFVMPCICTVQESS